MKMKKKVSVMLLAAAAALCMAATAFGAGNSATAISGTKGTKKSEDFDLLFDGSVGTKWCTLRPDPYVIFSLPSAQSITGYTLVTGSDSNRWLGRNPKSWTLYGCNSATAPGVDDSGWTVIDTVTDDDTMKNASSAAYTFNLDQAAPAYQYYKFQVDKKGQTMQLSELILNYPGSSQTVQQLVGGSYGTNNLTEGAEKLLDGRADTKWCTADTEPWIIFRMTQPTSAKGYYMVTGNDNSQYPGRNPKSWTLYGCNADTAPDEDYGGWEVVHQVTDDATMEDRNGTAYYFALDQASPAYEYYMLKVSEKNSFVMQLSEFAIDYEGLSYSFTGLGGSQTTAENGGGGITGTLTCGSCAGRGENHCFVCQGSGWDPLGEVCENCDGRGEVTCTACNGTGHLWCNCGPGICEMM